MKAAGPAGQISNRADASASPQRSAAVRINVGLGLIWLAALLAGGVVHATDADLRLEHPVALLPACLWLLWPARNATAQTIQAVVLLCLAWIVFAGAFDVFWTLPWTGQTHLRVSSMVPMVALIAAGWLCDGRCRFVPCRPSSYPARAVVWAAVLPAAHAGLLMAALYGIYGFGWEEDPAVFGRIALGVIVLVGLSPLAAMVPARASLSVLFTVVFLARCVL